MSAAFPKYWEFVETGQDVVALAESLYFDFAPYMEQEPHRILRDEGVARTERPGRAGSRRSGAERPSEIASRLGTAQTNLSRLLQHLLDTSILVRELPFGESVRSTKKILYRIQDPTMRFWFRCIRRTGACGGPTPRRKNGNSSMTMPLRSSRTFAGHVSLGPSGTGRAASNWTWSRQTLTIPKRLLVAEVKWRRLSAAERKNVLRQLESKWSRCSLRARYPDVRFVVLDASLLAA